MFCSFADGLYNYVYFSQILQAQLHLHGRYKSVSDRYSKLKKSSDLLKADKAKSDKAVKDLELENLAQGEELKRAREEVDRLTQELTKSKGAAAEQELQIAALEGQVQSIASAATVRARAELFKQYLAGENAQWDQQGMQDEVDAYEEELKLEAELAAEGDDVAEQVEEDLGVDKTTEGAGGVVQEEVDANPPEV